MNSALNKQKLLRGTSFLQVESSDQKAPKLQCSCKFIKSSKGFVNNATKLKPKLSSNKKTEFIEMKVKENLISRNKSKIFRKENGKLFLLNFLIFVEIF